MHAWQRWALIVAAVAALHGAALWAAHSYRAPLALPRQADALLTRIVELPTLVDVVQPKLAPNPTVTSPAVAITPPAAAAQPKERPKPATQATTQPTTVAQPSLPAGLQPAATPLAVLTSPSGNAPTAAPSAAEAAPAAAKAVTTVPVTLLPSTDADHADTQYRIPLSAISKRLGEAGRVMVRVQVGLDGKALQVQLKTSSGFARLDDNALATVARWRFKPGSVNGVPTVGWVEQPVDYTVE